MRFKPEIASAAILPRGVSATKLSKICSSSLQNRRL